MVIVLLLNQFCLLHSYMDALSSGGLEPSESATTTFDQLNAEVSRNPSCKNTELLRLAARFARILCVPLALACKSGKDRTGMAITLEVRIRARVRAQLVAYSKHVF
jgi:hypothetical protein